MDEKLLEKLASAQHDIWSHWTKHIINAGEFDNSGNLILPKEKVEKWKKQMELEYGALSEDEKESDREVVKFNLEKVLEKHFNKQ